MSVFKVALKSAGRTTLASGAPAASATGATPLALHSAFEEELCAEATACSVSFACRYHFRKSA
eukprot:1830192-Lingulodinium_polyedra.AAC.1